MATATPPPPPVKKAAHIAVIDRIEPNPMAEKPNIFVGAHNADNPKIRINNTYYFHTDQCGRISKEQLNKLFKLDPREIAVQADALVKDQLRVKYEQTKRKDSDGMNTSFYPEFNACSVEEASAFDF